MGKEEGWKNLTVPKKGEVRNPKGRPKGSKNVKTILKKFLDKPDTEDPNLSVMEATLLKLIGKARKGDLAALNMLMDRTEGKPVQKNMNANVDLSYEDYLETLNKGEDDDEDIPPFCIPESDASKD